MSRDWFDLHRSLSIDVPASIVGPDAAQWIERRRTHRRALTSLCFSRLYAKSSPISDSLNRNFNFFQSIRPSPGGELTALFFCYCGPATHSPECNSCHVNPCSEVASDASVNGSANDGHTPSSSHPCPDQALVFANYESWLQHNKLLLHRLESGLEKALLQLSLHDRRPFVDVLSDSQRRNRRLSRLLYGSVVLLRPLWAARSPLAIELIESLQSHLHTMRPNDASRHRIVQLLYYCDTRLAAREIQHIRDTLHTDIPSGHVHASLDLLWYLGCPQAQQQMRTHYFEQLFVVAKALSRDYNEANDLRSQILAEISDFAFRWRYRTDRSFLAYANARMKTMWRDNKRRESGVVPLRSSGTTTNVTDSVATVDFFVEALGAHGPLTHDERLVLLMHDTAGLTFKEIGKTLGRNMAWAYKTYTTAVEKLYGLYGPDG